MALAGFSLDISSVEVVKDPQVSAILSSLAKNHPGGYRAGAVSLKTPAPAIVGEDGRVVAVPAELGTFLSTTIRYSMTYRAEEAAYSFDVPYGLILGIVEPFWRTFLKIMAIIFQERQLPCLVTK